MEHQQLNAIINLLGKFKDLKRMGWLKRKVIQPESDAEHSFSLAMLVLLFAPQNIDKLKCLKLALVHDFAEIYAGDYTPDDQISAEQKHQLEMTAIEKISTELSKPCLVDLFSEFEAQRTKESQFVKALDKIDTALTACYYDRNNRSPEKLLPEFGAYAKKCLKEADFDEISFIKDILDQILTENS